MASFFEDYQKKKSETGKNALQQANQNKWTSQPKETQKKDIAKNSFVSNTNDTVGSYSPPKKTTATAKKSASSSSGAKKTVTPSNVSSKSNTSNKFVPNTKKGGFYADLQARQEERTQQRSGSGLFGGQVSSPIIGGVFSTPTNRRFTPSTAAGRKTTNEIYPNTRIMSADKVTGSTSGVNGVSQGLSKRLGDLLTEYDKITRSGRSGLEFSREVENLTRKNADIFRDYARETGSELTYPGLIDMFDKQAKRVVSEIRKQQDAAAKADLRQATLKDLTVNSFKQGYYNTLYGEEMYKALGGRANNAAAYQAELNKNDYQFAADNMLERAISGAAGQIGQMVRNATNPTTAGLVGAGIGGAAVAGQAGPLVAVPDELISIPAAAGAGYMLGSAANMMKVEAGLAYDEMLQNGISPETASKIALGVGGANAVLEAVQLDDLLKSFRILSRSGATENAAVNLAKALLRRGVNVATETGEEVAQEAVTVGGAQLANKLDKGEWAYSGDEMRNRLLDTAGSSALTFGALGAAGDIAGAGIGAYGDYRDTSRLGREIRNQNDVENVYDEGLRQGTGTEAYRQARRFTPNTASDYRVGRQANLNAEAAADEARMARLVNERTGYNVNYRNDMPNYAAGTNADGNIDINANKGQRVDTVMHEIGHIDSPEAEAAAEKTIEILKKPENAEQFEARKNVLRDTYDRQGIAYTDELLEREIATDMRRGMYRTASDYDKVTRTDNYGRDRFVPNTVRRVTSNVKSAFGGMVTNENTGITISAKDANTIREAWERADNAAAGAYRAGSAAQTGGTDYSIQTDAGGRKYIKVDTDQDIFDGVDEKDYNQVARMYILDYLRGETPLGENNTATIDRRSGEKYTNPGKRQANFTEKMRLSPELQNVLSIARKVSESPSTKSNSRYSNYEYYDFDFELGGKRFNALINIGVDKEGNRYFYDINKIHTVGGIAQPNGTHSHTNNMYDNNISQNNGNVKYSVDTNAENETARSFGITNINDYIHVQRSVNNTLMNEGFFSDEGGRSRTVINADSGMVIEITPKGIKETFGEKNYKNLGKRLKTAKLSTVRDLPSLIENGKMIVNDATNTHNSNSVLKYAYIQANAEIDGIPAIINIDIRKSPDKNKFWVHRVDFKQNNSGVPNQNNISDMGSNYSATNNIPQNNGNVKYSIDTNAENEDTAARVIRDIAREYNSSVTDEDIDRLRAVLNEGANTQRVREAADNIGWNILSSSESGRTIIDDEDVKAISDKIINRLSAAGKKPNSRQARRAAAGMPPEANNEAAYSAAADSGEEYEIQNFMRDESLIDTFNGESASRTDRDKLNRHNIIPKTEQFGEKFIAAQVDKLYPIKSYERYAENIIPKGEDGKKVEFKGRNSPYVMASNSIDAQSRAKYILTEELTDFDANPIGESLADIVGDLSYDDYQDFNTYLKLRHGLEWVEKDKDYKPVFGQHWMNDPAAMKAGIRQLDEKHPDFADTAARVYKYQADLMRAWLVDTGIITADTYDKLRQKYPEYVPFFRKDDTPTRGRGKNGIANQGNPIQEAEGGSQVIYDPIESIMFNASKFVNAAAKNAAMQSITDIFDTVPGMEVYMAEAVKDESSGKYKLKKGGEKTDTTEATETEPQTREEFEEYISDAVQHAIKLTDGDIVSVLQNGKKRYFKVFDKNFLEAVDNLHPIQVGPVMRAVASTTRMFSAFATNFNPMFTLASNPIKDTQNAFAQTIRKNPFSVVSGIVDAQIEQIANSDMGKKIGQIKNPDYDGTDTYKKYMAMGGEYASAFSAGRNAINETLNEIKPNKKGVGTAAKNAAKFVPRAYGKTADAIETAPRLSEFKYSMKAGNDVHQAHFDSKNVTLNFGRSGYVGERINKFVPFYNPSVQGISKMIQSFKNKPLQTSLRVAAMTAISAASLIWNGRKKEDEEEYNNASSYLKNNYYLFHTGDGKFFKVPKSQEYGLVPTLIERAVEKFAYDNPDAFYNFGDYISTALLPSIFKAEFPFVDTGSIIGLGTYTSLLENKDFKGAPIVPDYMQDEVPKEQYDDRTSYIARYIGKALNWSPKKVDYVINSNTGFLGKINESVLHSGEKDYFLGMKTKFSADSLFSTDQVNMFYDNRDEAEKQAKSYPGVENDYLKARYAQSGNVLSIINSIYKTQSADGDTEAARETRRAYVNYARDNKDNPAGLSAEVYEELERLYDTDSKVLSMPGINTTGEIKAKIDGKEQSYSFKTSDEIINYQNDLNKNVDTAYWNLINSDEYQTMDDIDKTGELEKAQKSAVNEVKAFYVQNQGKKRMFEDEAQTAEEKPSGGLFSGLSSGGTKPAESPAPTARPTPTPNPNAERDKQVNTYMQTVSSNFTKVNPDKDGYDVNTMKIGDISTVEIDDAKYSLTRDTKAKVTEAANAKYYADLERYMSGEANIEDIIGYAPNGKAKYSNDNNNKRVYLTGKRFNEDGSERFDETISAKIIFRIRDAALEAAANEYKSEITGAVATTAPTQVSNAAASPASAETEASDGGLPFETSAEAAEVPDRQVGETIASTAEKYVGTPYVWGGESENGWDCSGYVINIFDKFGIHIPERTTQAQWRSGTGVRITNQEDLQPGDCLYFANSNGDVHHVAIYMGDGMMVHAKGRNYGTVTESFADSGYYQSQFIGAKRYYTAGDSTVIPDTSSGGTRFRARSSGSSGTSRSSGSTRFRARSSASSGVTQFRARSASGTANTNGIRFRARDTFLPSSSFIGNTGGVTGFVGGAALTGGAGSSKNGLAKIEIPKFI